jgi:hypothetical protein
LALTDVMLLRSVSVTPLRVKVIEFSIYSREPRPSKRASAEVVADDRMPKPEPSSCVWFVPSRFPDGPKLKTPVEPKPRPGIYCQFDPIVPAVSPGCTRALPLVNAAVPLVKAGALKSSAVNASA